MGELAVDLNQALRRFGTGNKMPLIRPPESQDPLDAYLHGLYVADTARKFFDPDYKRRINAISENLGEDASQKISKHYEAAKAGACSTLPIASTPNFALSLKTSSARVTYSHDALYAAMRKHGVKADLVTTILQEAAKVSEPSKTFIVTPI